jgi:hypothetical protein
MDFATIGHKLSSQKLVTASNLRLLAAQRIQVSAKLSKHDGIIGQPAELTKN